MRLSTDKGAEHARMAAITDAGRKRLPAALILVAGEEGIGITDAEYRSAGASVASSVEEMFGSAD